MSACPCGLLADNVISLSPNYHVKACSLCAVQWPLVRSAIQAAGKAWTINDFNAWRRVKEMPQ